MRLFCGLKHAFNFSNYIQQEVTVLKSMGFMELKNKFYDLNPRQIVDMKKALLNREETPLVRELHQQFLTSLPKNRNLVSIVSVLSFYNKKLESYDVDFWTASIKQIHFILRQDRVQRASLKSQLFSLVASLNGLIIYGKVGAASIKEIHECTLKIHQMLLADHVTFNLDDYSRLLNSFRNYPDQKNLAKVLDLSAKCLENIINRADFQTNVTIQEITNFIYSYSRVVFENQEYLMSQGVFDQIYKKINQIVNESKPLYKFLEVNLKADLNFNTVLQLVQGFKYFNSYEPTLNELLLSALKRIKHHIPLKNLIKAIHGFHNPKLQTKASTLNQISLDFKEMFDAYLQKSSVEPPEFVEGMRALFGTQIGYDLQVKIQHQIDKVKSYLQQNWDSYDKFVMNKKFTLDQLLKIFKIYSSMQYDNANMSKIIISKIKEYKPINNHSSAVSILLSMVVCDQVIQEKEFAQVLIAQVIQSKPLQLTPQELQNHNMVLFATLDENIQQLLQGFELLYSNTFRDLIRKQNEFIDSKKQAEYNVEQELSYMQSLGYLKVQKEARFGPYFLDLVISQIDEQKIHEPSQSSTNHGAQLDYSPSELDYYKMDGASLNNFIFVEIDGPFHYIGDKLRGQANLKSRIFKKMFIKVFIKQLFKILYVNRKNILTYLNDNNRSIDGFMRQVVVEHLKQ